MKNILVNNFKDDLIFLSSIFLLIFACKNPEQKQLNIIELSNLDNYEIKETKINDSVTKIYGENSKYIIEGKINLHNNSRQKWWKVKSKYNKNWFEIEYIFLDKQIENQIKVYNDGMLDNRSSKFYNVNITKQNSNFDFYFPISKYSIYDVEFDYIISDTLRKKRLREGKIKCKKVNDHYTCNLPLNNEENSVMGIVTAFSSFKEKDSISLAADRIFIKSR